MSDAVLFFDECESIFMDRTKGNLQVNTVLTELERHEGLCILATNRPMDLDEAMHRRITLAIEFNKPDLLLREKAKPNRVHCRRFPGKFRGAGGSPGFRERVLPQSGRFNIFPQ